MNTILHGNNIVVSRQNLSRLISEAKQSGVKEVIHLDGLKLSETSLRQALEAQSLFGSDKLVVIEKLLSRPRSKEKSTLIQVLSQTKTSTLLWEPKQVTQPNLKPLKNHQVQLFKTPPAIFKFLDNLKPGNSKFLLTTRHNGLRNQVPELIFYMLSRRVSDLIIASDKNSDQLLKAAPWQKGKLKSQAQSFTASQLLSLHEELLTIDKSIKTGQSLLPLSSQLDLLLTKI